MFFNTVQAKIIKDEKIITGESTFNFKEVCKKLTNTDAPLIDIVSISKLNCMGTAVDVSSFCDEKEAANPYYIRAHIDKEKKHVVCQSSKRVILKYACEGKEDPYCQDVETGCFLFKEKLAKRLKVVHQSLSEKQILSCYFDINVKIAI